MPPDKISQCVRSQQVATVCVEKAAARAENLLEQQKEAVPSGVPCGASHADSTARNKLPALKIRATYRVPPACCILWNFAEFICNSTEFHGVKLHEFFPPPVMIWLIPGGVKVDKDVSKSPVTFDVLAVGRQRDYFYTSRGTDLSACLILASMKLYAKHLFPFLPGLLL